VKQFVDEDYIQLELSEEKPHLREEKLPHKTNKRDAERQQNKQSKKRRIKEIKTKDTTWVPGPDQIEIQPIQDQLYLQSCIFASASYVPAVKESVHMM
jgi:hypothetical protein